MQLRILPMPWLRLLVALLLLATAHAGHAADEFLEPEQAFKVAARPLDDRTVEVSVTVAPGYYLYREQFKFQATGATLGAPVLPQGKVKFDETFQKNVETYRDVVRVAIPVTQGERDFRLVVTSQGCADAGLCYPPMQTGFKVSLNGFGGNGSVQTIAASELPVSELSGGASPATSTAAAESSRVDGSSLGSSLGSALREGRFWPVIGAFFIAGVLLSLTPCVLPMLPIVSSIIAGHGTEVTRGRGLALAAAYSLGMALVYTALGVAAGLAGEGLAAALQTPWVLGLFALGLVALSLSMFGAYELRLPSAFTSRVTQASGRLPAGRIAGVCAMGGVSALIVSPCVAAPLAGALVYISQTRDVLIGGSALFAMAIGMSVPLLLVGISAGTLLPRAGGWMDAVKRVFGVLMLGVALWMVSPVLPPVFQMAGWAVLGLGYGAYLLASRGAPWLSRAVGIAVAALGLVQFVGLATGGRDALAPLAHLQGGAAKAVEFKRIKSSAQLDALLATAAGKTVLLDFYADWCVSCKEMEKLTFTDRGVQQQLADTLLLQVDVTANDADDRAMLKRFGLFGPPGIILFDRKGQELRDSRIIGFQNPRKFSRSLAPLGTT